MPSFFDAFKLPKIENARFVDPKWNHDHCGDDPRGPSHYNQQFPLSQCFGIGGDQKTVHQHVGNKSLGKDPFFSYWLFVLQFGIEESEYCIETNKMICLIHICVFSLGIFLLLNGHRNAFWIS